MESPGYQEIDKNIYWLGLRESVNELHCNTYCIVDGDEAVLIDPGSVLDFPEIRENLFSLVSKEQLKYIILHHQDPDLCSALPLFEKEGVNTRIVTHWRTSLMVRYYGTSSPYYIVNEHGSKLVFGDNRVLEFYDTPYLHFPGAIATFDRKTGTLFSGDVFGAIGGQWSLYANDSYLEVMKSFHEHYVPSNEVIRPVMERFLTVPIRKICPQHGSIINKNIKEHIITLRDLECGMFLNPVKKEAARAGGVLSIVNNIIKRLISTYGEDSIKEVFENSPFSVDSETGLIKGFPEHIDDPWQAVFRVIYSRKGIRWLTVIEPLVRKISAEYTQPLPEIYKTALGEEEKKSDVLEEENRRLQKLNQSLKNTVELTREEFTKDPVTRLYNEDFFVQYLINLLLEKKIDSISILFIGVDEMAELNRSFGEDRGDEVLSSCAYLLLNEKKPNHMVFRLKGPLFAAILSDVTKEEAVAAAENYRLSAEQSSLFFTPVTVSAAVVSLDEQRAAVPDVSEKPVDFMNYLFTIGKGMINRARREGGNTVVEDYLLKEAEQKTGRILVLEYDDFHARLLREALEALSMEVRVCTEGGKAAAMIKEFHPDLIISEIYLLETDIFQIRQELSRSVREKEIPIIMVSHQKDEAEVIRAINLGILHYFKKPYIMAELLGLADRLVRAGRMYGT